MILNSFELIIRLGTAVPAKLLITPKERHEMKDPGVSYQTAEKNQRNSISTIGSPYSTPMSSSDKNLPPRPFSDIVTTESSPKISEIEKTKEFEKPDGSNTDTVKLKRFSDIIKLRGDPPISRSSSGYELPLSKSTDQLIQIDPKVRKLFLP